MHQACCRYLVTTCVAMETFTFLMCARVGVSVGGGGYAAGIPGLDHRHDNPAGDVIRYVK